MRTRRRRRSVRWGWRVAVGLVVLLLAVHTPPARRSTQDWLTSWIAREASLQFTATGFEYNLLTRRITARGVTLAAPGHERTPVLTAGEVEVRLPWAAYTGRAAVQSLRLSDAVVTVATDADGVSNLPPSGGGRPASPRHLDILGLAVRNLDFVYLDAENDVEVRVSGIRASLDRTAPPARESVSGTVAATRGLTIRGGTQRTSSARAEGRLTFDGDAVTLRTLRLSFPEADVTLDGRITRVLDAAELDLRFTGLARLAESATWIEPPMRVGGAAKVDGTITGPLAAIRLTGTYASDDLSLGRATGLGFTGRALLTRDAITLDPIAVTSGTAEADARVVVPFDELKSSTVQGTWLRVPIETALAIAGQEAMPVAGLLDGSMTADLGVGPLALPTVILESRTHAIERRGTLPLEGLLTARLAGGRWQAAFSHQVPKAIRFEAKGGGTVDSDDPASSALTGTLDVQVTDLKHAVSALRRAGIDAPAIAADAAGQLSAAFQLGGRVGAPTLSGTVASEDLLLPGIGPGRLTLSLSATPDAVRIEDLRLAAAEAVLTADASITLANRSIDGRFQIEASALEQALSMLPADWRPSGSATAAGTIGGTLDQPQAIASISAGQLVAGRQHIDALRADLRVSSESIDVDSLTIIQGSGRVDAAGRYAWTSGAYTANVEAHGLVIEDVVGAEAGARARVDLSFNGSGTVDRPLGRGRMTFDMEGGSIGPIVRKGSADLVLEGDVARIHALVPALGADISGAIQPLSPYAYRAEGVLDRFDLAPIALLAGAREGAIDGSVNLTTLLTGNLNDVGSLAATIDVQQFAAYVNGVPVALAAPARLHYEAGVLGADDLRGRIGTGELRAAGGSGLHDRRASTATLQAEASELLRMARAFPGVPSELNARGRVRVDWTSAPGWTAHEATLAIANGAVGWSDVPPVTGLEVQAAFDGSTFRMTRLSGLWQEGTIDATARLPRTLFDERARAEAGVPGVARVRVTGLTQAALAPWLEQTTIDRMTGRLSGTLDAEIDALTVAGIRGALVFDEAAMAVDDIPIRQQQPSRLTLADGRLRMDDVRWTAGGSPLVLGGSVDVAAQDPTLALELTGRADLRVLQAFVPGIAAQGAASMDVRIGGTAGTPRFSGHLTLDDVGLALRDPQLIVSGVGGTIRLDGNRIVFQDLTGEANGGRTSVTGSLDTAGLGFTGGMLNLRLQGAALEYPRGLQSEVDATLQFTPGPGDPRLTGTVRILRGAYLAPISLPAVVAASRAVARPVRREPTYAETIRLDLSVVTVTDLIVDNNYGRFEAGAELQVLGTVSEPGLAGRATLREGGQVYLAGNTFRIERGNVSFISPTRIEPDVDIQARALVSGQDVTLTLSGTLDRLETDIRSSDPTVPASEIVSLLLGSPGAGYSSTEAVALLSAELLGATSRAVGLDALRVERGFGADDIRADPGLIATETDPSARLTLSKRLRPDVEVIVSQNLREAGLSTIVNYRPRRNFELRAVSHDNLDRAYSLRHEITVGGGSRVPGASAAAATRVSTVSIAGPGVDEAELAGRLRLKPGKRFDFHTWQRDLDTLRAVYRKQGRYEAVVRALRQPDDAAGTVALSYQVEPGPETAFVIAGYRAPPQLLTELQGTWSRSVFDEFLIRDVVGRTRSFLVERGFVSSVVRAEVERPADGRKVVRLTIEPGQAVARREIRFEGRNQLDEGVLTQAIEAAGLGVEGWISPDRLRQPIEDAYAIAGFFDARVRPGQPERVGDRAQLLVRIDEGPRYAFGAVTVEGVTPARLEGVQRDAAVETGAAYSVEVIEQVRRRVETRYWRLGFNSVRVDVRPALDQTAATVGIAIRIEEGPQQVLAAVEESGATRTRAGAIEHALRLPVGDPVDLGEWALARKRLYDTNVFRQVDLQVEPLGEPADGVQPVRARITVEEWPAWRLRYGLQVDDIQAEESLSGTSAGRTQSLGVVADLQSQNLFGLAIGAGLYGRYEQDRRSASANISFPRVFRLPVTTNVFLFGEHEKVHEADYLAFVNDRTGVSAEQRWRRTRSVSVSWSYRFERSHTYDPAADPDDFFPLDVTFDVARLSATTALDYRDDPFNTRKGWFSSLTFEYAAKKIGSDLRLAKLFVQQKSFQPVGPLVLASVLQAGTAFSYDLIPSERFRAGGAYTVRGYAENGLGPVDYFGRPRGGNAMLAFSQEVRFPVYRWVAGVAFFDAGNVFSKRQDMSFADLKAGYGVGLRVDTPFGLLRVDFGVPASRSAGEPRGRWYFGVGHVF